MKMTRLFYFFGILVIAGLLLISVYLQFYEGILPCPLCTLQRLTFGLIGLVFIGGIFLHDRFWGRVLTTLFLAVASILGIALAGRQIWLQHFSVADASECGVSIEYMAKVLPLNELLKKILAGSVECSSRGWEFLHLNMAEWACLWFAAFLLLACYLACKEFAPHSK